eukprot:1159784-Pelagomonas_calceolata.AAC.2
MDGHRQELVSEHAGSRAVGYSPPLLSRPLYNTNIDRPPLDPKCYPWVPEGLHPSPLPPSL